jgi:hypothetical protein
MIRRIALLTAGMLLVSGLAFAQASATGTATANILEALAISSDRSLVFGSIVPGTASSDVVVTADATGDRSTTGTALLVTGATPTAARFNVTGTSGAGYTVALAAPTTTITNGTVNMTVTLTMGANPTRTLAGATEVHYVGGTLTVPSAQATGTYTGSFTVNANYN